MASVKKRATKAKPAPKRTAKARTPGVKKAPEVKKDLPKVKRTPGQKIPRVKKDPVLSKARKTAAKRPVPKKRTKTLEPVRKTRQAAPVARKAVRKKKAPVSATKRKKKAQGKQAGTKGWGAARKYNVKALKTLKKSARALGQFLPPAKATEVLAPVADLRGWGSARKYNVKALKKSARALGQFLPPTKVAEVLAPVADLLAAKDAKIANQAARLERFEHPERFKSPPPPKSGPLLFPGEEAPDEEGFEPPSSTLHVSLQDLVSEPYTAAAMERLGITRWELLPNKRLRGYTPQGELFGYAVRSLDPDEADSTGRLLWTDNLKFDAYTPETFEDDYDEFDTAKHEIIFEFEDL